MAWWTNILSDGWALAGDLLAELWPIAVVPVAFAVVAFVWGLVLSLRG